MTCSDQRRTRVVTSVAEALADFRADEARCFKNKYDHGKFTVLTGEGFREVRSAREPHPSGKNATSVGDSAPPRGLRGHRRTGINRVDIRLLPETGLSINVLYTLDGAFGKRAVGFKLSPMAWRFRTELGNGSSSHGSPRIGRVDPRPRTCDQRAVLNPSRQVPPSASVWQCGRKPDGGVVDKPGRTRCATHLGGQPVVRSERTAIVCSDHPLTFGAVLVVGNLGRCSTRDRRRDSYPSVGV